VARHAFRRALPELRFTDEPGLDRIVVDIALDAAEVGVVANEAIPVFGLPEGT
jgi:hypothetical protein